MKEPFMKELRGRVAVVTGAASGMGLAMAERFAAEGMRVVMADLPDSPLATEAARVAASGADVLAHATDVASWDAVQGLAAATKARFGGAHVLCNNAGVRTMGNVWNISLQDWHWVININLWGVIHGMKAFLPDMLARGEPAHIVNTASTAGLIAMGDNGPYTASKFGVVGVSESLRVDLDAAKAPIGVSVLCPGRVPTNIRINSNKRRPSGEPVTARQAAATARPVEASEVAHMVLDAIRNKRFWVLTHPEFGELVTRRARGIAETGEFVPMPD